MVITGKPRNWDMPNLTHCGAWKLVLDENDRALQYNNY